MFLVHLFLKFSKVFSLFCKSVVLDVKLRSESKWYVFKFFFFPKPKSYTHTQHVWFHLHTPFRDPIDTKSNLSIIFQTIMIVFTRIWIKKHGFTLCVCAGVKNTSYHRVPFGSTAYGSDGVIVTWNDSDWLVLTWNGFGRVVCNLCLCVWFTRIKRVALYTIEMHP